MDNKERMKVLQARRNSIKGSLTSFQTFLSNYTPKDRLQLNMRFQKLNSQFQDFDDFHDQLDAMDNAQSSINERFVILESYYQAMSIAQQFLSDGSSEAPVEVQFDQKIFPVKAESLYSPTHSSKSVFSGLEISLPSTQDKYTLISREISWFLNLPKEAENDHETIENFVSELQRHVQSLSDLGVTVPQEFIIVLVQERFLNKASREKWESSVLLQDDFPTLDQLFKFLSKMAFMSRQQYEEKCRREEASPVRRVSRTPERRHEEKLRREASPVRSIRREASPVRSIRREASPVRAIRREASPVRAIRTKASERRPRIGWKCFACSKGCYHLSQCLTFKQFSVRQRLNLITDLKICKICLNKHPYQECMRINNCKICDKRHSTYLHMSE